MARVEYNPVDLSEFMPHFRNMEFTEHEDNSELKLALDEIKEFLKGNSKHYFEDSDLAATVEHLFDYSLHKSNIVSAFSSPKIGQIKYKKEVLDKLLSFEERDISEIKLPQLKETKVSTHEFSNYSVASLLTQMPLFYENMFSAFFTISDGKDDFFDLTSSKGFIDKTPYKKSINSFGVNISEFEIPQAKNQTYTVKFLDREIKKVASSYEFSHKVELSFDVDQMGMLIQQFQILSYGGQGNNYKLDLSPVSENKYYAQQFFPSSFRNRNQKIKLFVMFNNMKSQYRNVLQVDDNSSIRNGQNQIIGSKASYKAFIFENVQFLGFTGPLEFSRDSVNSLKLTAEFRFQTLKEFDNNKIN